MSNSIQFRRSTVILALVAASIGGGLIAAFAVMSHNNAPVEVTARAQTTPTQSSQRVNQLSDSFANVIEKASPAVVEISMTRVVKASEQQQNNPFLSDPFFRQFFGGQLHPRPQREEGLGSGVIVSPSGYIVTNNHVVSHATSLKVTLSDGREFSAKTVGTDPQTDVAVVKINATNLPVLPFANSDSARVGDIVFAIGNPFGEEHTVTMGIVSAKNRQLGGGSTNIQNFIQTDAAINPGNSGGALINAQGQMIAMNTAILTGGNTFGGGEGGNIGIGFAIPSDMVKQVMDQLMKTGKVSRGYIGVMLQGMNADLANQFHVNTTHAALVAKVDPGTPGAKAGLQPGDVIVGINGEKVDGVNDATLKVTEHAPGSTIVLDVVRNGKPMKVNVTLGTRPTSENFGEQNGNQNENQEQQNNGQGGNASVDGITVETLTPDLAQQVNVPAGTKGVVVDSVDQAAPAADRIGRGMVITQVNRHPVNNAQEFDRLMNESKGKPVMLTVMADNVPQFVVIQPYNK